MIDGRARQLQEKTRDGIGFGKDVVPPSSNWKRSVSFLRDRWPRVVFVDESYEIVLQWLVHDGVVIQQTTIQNLTNEPLTFQHTFDFDVLIRELDFIDPSYKFNEEEGDGGEDDENYKVGPGPNEYGFVRVHKLPTGENANENYQSLSDERWCMKDEPNDVKEKEEDSRVQPEAVGVVMGLFMNGEAKKLEDFKETRDFEIPPKERIEFTTGYKLILLGSKKSDWKCLTLSAKEVDVDFILAESTFDNIDGLGLDFPARRNIQHILSVCVVPVVDHLVWKGRVEDVVEPGSKDSQVALTCGDMSGHRICNSASLYVCLS